MANSTVSEDITNLFKTFGGDTDHYQEMVSAPDLALSVTPSNSVAGADINTSEPQTAATQVVYEQAETPEAHIQSSLTEDVDYTPSLADAASASSVPSSARAMDSNWAKNAAAVTRADLFLTERPQPAWVSLWRGKVARPNTSAADIPSVERKTVAVSLKKPLHASQRAAWAPAKPAVPLVSASSLGNPVPPPKPSASAAADVPVTSASNIAETPVPDIKPPAAVAPAPVLPDMSQGKKAKRDQVFLEPKPLVRKVKRFTSTDLHAIYPAMTDASPLPPSNVGATEHSVRAEPTFTLKLTKTRSSSDK